MGNFPFLFVPKRYHGAALLARGKMVEKVAKKLEEMSMERGRIFCYNRHIGQSLDCLFFYPLRQRSQRRKTRRTEKN